MLPYRIEMPGRPPLPYSRYCGKEEQRRAVADIMGNASVEYARAEARRGRPPPGQFRIRARNVLCHASSVWNGGDRVAAAWWPVRRITTWRSDTGIGVRYTFDSVSHVAAEMQRAGAELNRLLEQYERGEEHAAELEMLPDIGFYAGFSTEDRHPHWLHPQFDPGGGWKVAEC